MKTEAEKYGLEYNNVKNIINTDKNSVWSIVCSKIEPNSRILEFGPAKGYITRYLKEEKNCSLTIVEVDSNCAKIASDFAETTIVGDIETYNWKSQLRENKFDYIIFMDVLEHLKDPWQALRESKLFLKPEGSILISLPNIGHNSVLIDLWNDKFEYQQLGILDNTHLRFFTESSAKELIKIAGLNLISIEKSFKKENFSENFFKGIPYLVKVFMTKRKNGNVYQFVLKVKK